MYILASNKNKMEQEASFHRLAEVLVIKLIKGIIDIGSIRIIKRTELEKRKF